MTKNKRSKGKNDQRKNGSKEIASDRPAPGAGWANPACACSTMTHTVLRRCQPKNHSSILRAQPCSQKPAQRQRLFCSVLPLDGEGVAAKLSPQPALCATKADRCHRCEPAVCRQPFTDLASERPIMAPTKNKSSPPGSHHAVPSRGQGRSTHAQQETPRDMD